MFAAPGRFANQTVAARLPLKGAVGQGPSHGGDGGGELQQHVVSATPGAEPGNPGAGSKSQYRVSQIRDDG